MVARTLVRSEEHTSELQSLRHLVCRLLLEKKKIVQRRLRLVDFIRAFSRVIQAGYFDDDYQVFRSHGYQDSEAFPITFFFNDTATTEIYTLSLRDALPISRRPVIYQACPSPVFVRNSSPPASTP